MDKVSDELREFLRTYFSVTEYVASIEAFDPTDISYVTDERVLNIIRLDEEQRGLGDYHTVRDKLYFATTLVGALLPDRGHAEDEATKIQKSKFFEDFRAAFPKPEYELFEKFTGNKVVIYRLSLVIDDGKLNNLLVSIEMKKPVPGLSPEIDLFLYENRFVLVQETASVKVGDTEISSGFHRYSNGGATFQYTKYSGDPKAAPNAFNGMIAELNRDQNHSIKDTPGISDVDRYGILNRDLAKQFVVLFASAVRIAYTRTSSPDGVLLSIIALTPENEYVRLSFQR